MKTFSITGEWKNFEFKNVEEKDFADVLKHMRDGFYCDEPTQIIVGTDEERANDLDARLTLFLKEKMTFMALCKSTKKIAGVIISSHFSKTYHHVELVAKSPLTPLVRAFMIKAEEDANVFGNCGVDEYGEIFIVAVLREFRNCGLATEMFGRAVSMLKDMGYPVIMCMFSNPYSRKLGERFGFKELSRSRYIDAKDEKGDLIMPTATPDQFLNVTVLDLREVKQ